MTGTLLSRLKLSDGSGLGLNIRQLFIEGLDAAVLLDQVHGRLFPHAGNTGDIVGGIPHEGLQVDHMDGVKSVLLPECLLRHILGGGLPHAGGDQLHLGLVRDELQGVLVSRHHHALPAGGFALAGDGSDEIVRLPALQLVAGDIQGIQHLLEHRHLHSQFLRHGLAGGFVGLICRVAEGGGMNVKGDAQRVRSLLPHQTQQSGQKAEDRMGIEPFPVGQRADAVIGPVDDAVAVDDHEFHGSDLLFWMEDF